MEAAALIREARKRAGITQAELAALLGTTQSTVARWEAGAVSPTVATLDRIVGACGLMLSAALLPASELDASQIAERLRWTPQERLDYLLEMLDFEERAHSARRLDP